MMYEILAFYLFQPVSDPEAEVRLHKEYFKNRDIRCRIYINEQGINAQMSLHKEESLPYRNWLTSRPPFEKVHFKIDPYHEHVFPKTIVKKREQLVAFDAEVDLSKAAPHLSPQEWKEKLESHEKPLLIDVRNDYEWKVGHFEGADLPACKTFREFNDYADALKRKVNPKKQPVMMYCTGGIRCELYSAALKMRGFEEVYQLEGGVINYGHQVGADHFQGKLFVFDDRMTTDISKKENEPIAMCAFCSSKTDHYYNCANMDCNELFLCCKECLAKTNGCCSSSCMEEPRIRPLDQQNPHKPFRKKRFYQTTQQN